MNNTNSIVLKESTEDAGITVAELINFLKSCPKDAKVLLNHKVRIANPEDDDTYSYGWCFDTIAEAQCEEIIDKNRYTEYKSDNKIVWLTHQYE